MTAPFENLFSYGTSSEPFEVSFVPLEDYQSAQHKTCTAKNLFPPPPLQPPIWGVVQIGKVTVPLRSVGGLPPHGMYIC